MLPPKEMEALYWAHKGLPIKLIAVKMKVKYRTAKEHIANIKEKTGVHSKCGLIKLYQNAIDSHQAVK